MIRRLDRALGRIALGVAIALSLSGAASAPAVAGAAVVWGASTVHTRIDSDRPRIALIQEALEACSSEDTGCKLLLKCSGRGHGAVARAVDGDHIAWVSAVCNRETAHDARETVLNNCRLNTEERCSIYTVWVDESGR